MANNYYFKVNKGLSLTPQTTPPTVAKKGDLYFDDGLNLLQAYDGSAWNNVGGGGQVLTIGTGLNGGSYDGTTPVTIDIDNTVVATLTDIQTLTNKTIEQSPSIQSSGLISSTSIFPTNVPSASYVSSTLSTTDISIAAITNDGLGNAFDVTASSLQNGSLQFFTSSGATIYSYEPFLQSGVPTIEPQALTIEGEDVTINAKTNLAEAPSTAGSVFINTLMDTVTTGYDTGSINLTTGNTDDGDSGNIVLQTGTTMTGTRGSIQLNASSVSVSSKITNVTDPTASQDAATKNYVDLLRWTIANAVNLIAGDTITLSSNSPMQAFRVASTSGAITLSSLPFTSAAPGDAKCVRLIGTSDTNTVSLTHNDAAKGCLLNGNCTLVRGSVIEFMYSLSDDRYYEVSRNF